jgi:hypothetical protein
MLLSLEIIFQIRLSINKVLAPISKIEKSLGHIFICPLTTLPLLSKGGVGSEETYGSGKGFLSNLRCLVLLVRLIKALL